jgi:hypothetical protein
MAKLLRSIGASIATIATAATAFVLPASAAEEFNTQGIKFERDSIVEFEFIKSNNAAKSTFGVVNLATNEKTPLLSESKAFDMDGQKKAKAKKGKKVAKASYVGTPGKSVRKPFAEFTFKANTPYALYLESNGKGGMTTVYSNSLNGAPGAAQFDTDATALGSQGVRIGWNDGKGGSTFNQFMVVAGGGMGCPCKPSPGITAAPQPEAPVTPVKNTRPRGRG